MKNPILLLNKEKAVNAFLKSQVSSFAFTVLCALCFTTSVAAMNPGVTSSAMVSAYNATTSDTTEVEKHRVWLTLQTAGNTATTILVGYMAGATLGVDNGYDATCFGNTGSEFSSLIEGNEYIIQGRPLPFTTEDVVPLGFKATVAGNFSIFILNSDGVFAGDQDILINDKVTGITTSIKTAPYNFTSDIGTFHGRFELVYSNTIFTTLLDHQSIVKNETTLYSKDGMVFIQSDTAMDTVLIFDIQGRLLSENRNINNTYFSTDQARLVNQVLIVQVIDKEGGKVVKKIMLSS